MLFDLFLVLIFIEVKLQSPKQLAMFPVNNDCGGACSALAVDESNVSHL